MAKLDTLQEDAGSWQVPQKITKTSHGVGPLWKAFTWTQSTSQTIPQTQGDDTASPSSPCKAFLSLSQRNTKGTRQEPAVWTSRFLHSLSATGTARLCPALPAPHTLLPNSRPPLTQSLLCKNTQDPLMPISTSSSQLSPKTDTTISLGLTISYWQHPISPSVASALWVILPLKNALLKDPHYCCLHWRTPPLFYFSYFEKNIWLCRVLATAMRDLQSSL